MSSKQKRMQARRNGAKAAGAKSPAGIQKSSFNATKHGLSAKAHVLSTESQPDFDHLRQQYVDRFQPQDTMEMDLVDDMVGARWRLRRIAGLQTERLEMQMERYIGEQRNMVVKESPVRLLANAFGRSVNIEKSMEMLLRYEVTYSRMYDRALKALERIQKDNREEPDQPEESIASSELQNDPEPAELEPESGPEQQVLIPQDAPSSPDLVPATPESPNGTPSLPNQQTVAGGSRILDKRTLMFNNRNRLKPAACRARDF